MKDKNTMRKTILTIVAAAFMTISLNAASWDFTKFNQKDFYPTGQETVDGNYWIVNGSSSYQYKNQNSAAELYVADGQKFAKTEGLQFLTRGSNFRVFFNGAGIRLISQTESGVNPSIVIPNCKAGSDLVITAKRDGETSATMAVSNAATASLTLDGTVQTYTSTVLADGDVVVNMSAGTGYIRSISVYTTIATMSGANMTFTNKDLIIYSGNIALSTVTTSEKADDQGFAKASNIYLFTSSSAEGKTQALRVQATSTITVAAPSNYVIEKVGVRAATAAAEGTRTIKVNGANAESYGPVVENTESHYHEWVLATPSNTLQVSTNGSMYLIITLFGYTNDYYPVTISGHWASFCAPEDVELPAGVHAYIADIVRAEEGDDVLYINNAYIDKVHANTGVLLYSDVDGEYHLTATTGADAIEDNLFVGTVARTANPNTTTTYSLYNNSGTIEFWNYTGAYIPANKAYLTIGGALGAPAKRLRVQVGAKIPTGLDSEELKVKSEKRIENGQLVIIREGVKYNVQGQIVK